MSNATNMETSIWERLGDGLNSFSENFGSFLTRLFGSSNERDVRSLGYVRRAQTGEPAHRRARLAARTGQRARREDAGPERRGAAQHHAEASRTARQGRNLDDILPEAFAACREAGRRTKNMRHYDVQMIGGMVLHGGNIAEMVTGEGKTLVATLPAYLNALRRQGRPRRHGQRLPRPPRLRVDGARSTTAWA